MIDLFLPNNASSTFASIHANRLCLLLEKENISYRKIIFSEGDFSQYLFDAQSSPPLGAISFIPYLNNRFPLHYLFSRPLLQLSEINALEPKYSPYFHQALSDQKCTSLSNLHFMPMPFDADPSNAFEKNINLVLFQDLIDPQLIKELWSSAFTLAEAEKMIAFEKTIGKKGFHPLQALSHSEHISYAFYYACETYWTAKKAKSFVEKISEEVHILGTHVGGNWYQKLSNRENVHLHALPCYQQILYLLAHTKVAIFHPPNWLDGFPRYFLEAIEKKVIPLIPENPTLKKYFSEIDIFITKESLPEMIKKYKDETMRKKTLLQLQNVDLSAFNGNSFLNKILNIFRKN